MNAITEVQRKKVRRKPRRQLHEHIGLSLSPGNTAYFVQFISEDMEQCDSQRAQEIIEGKTASAEGFHAFTLGGALAVIERNHWYKEYGYSSFEDLIAKKLNLSASEAERYMKLYDIFLSKPGIPWKKIQHLRWTQIKWYGTHLTPDNVDQWVVAVEQAGDNYQPDFKVS